MSFHSIRNSIGILNLEQHCQMMLVHNRQIILGDWKRRGGVILDKSWNEHDSFKETEGSTRIKKSMINQGLMKVT